MKNYVAAARGGGGGTESLDLQEEVMAEMMLFIAFFTVSINSD